MLSALVKTNLNSDNQGQNNPSTEWIPLSEAAQFTPYSADYLSLLARKKRLTAKKIDGIWYTTKGIINNYLTQQAKRAEALNQSADNYLPFISESADPISQNVSEVPESNIRYSHTYAEDFQKIRGDLGQQITPVATDEVSVTKVPETPVVTLPPVLVSVPQKLPVASEVNYRNVSEPSEVIASGEEIASTPDTLKITQSNRRIEAPRYTTPATPAPELSPNKSVSGDELMEEFMRRFNAQIDRQVDSQHGFLFKVGRFIRRSYGYSLRSPKRLPLFIACLFLVVILPLRFVSGFADNFLADTMYAVKNAQTVMGFRPGTHENEILLLGPGGEIAIFGNVETEGQFRSYVEDGVAPITVKSTTKVENLNADMLDGVSGHEFTLAYVTKNGNITYEPVFLEGTVEVGETLLVKGATKLLNSLEVDGNLSVFGEANFAKGISVSGPAIFKDILTAPSVIVSGLLRAHKLIVEEDSIFEGLVTIKDDLDVEGSITASSGRIKGSFRVEEGFHAMQNVSLGSDAYTVRVTSAEWSVDNDGNAVFADVTGEDGDFSNLSVGGNASASTFTATNPNATSTFEGALSVGTTTSYEMLTLDGAFYLASIAAPTATSSRLHNQDGTLYWAGSAFAGPSLGTWSTDGTNVWRTTGNVGIGTSSPNVRLHVDGGDVRFNSTGGGPGLYFDESTGRLGLSTTTPDSLLTVAGTTNITGATTLGSTLNVIGNTTLANASTTNLTVSTNSYLGTVLSGTWNGSTIGVPYGGTGATSLTGLIIGNGTSAMTATTTSAGLATVLTDETGSGFAVFSVSPTFTGSATFADLIATNATTTTLTTTNFNCTDCLNDSEIEDIYVFNTGDSISGNLTFSGTAANIALGSNYLSGDGDDEGIFVDSTGNVGIGTTTPTQLFSVDGNTYITGGLGIGIATTSSGVLETTGNARIGGSLAVVGTTTTDKLAVNSYVISDLIPEVNAFYNLGSSARYWNDAYIDTLTVNNISAASTSISGTQSESFTINSDNVTADTENMDLVFYRGTVVPNALISWDAVRDRFDINQPFFIQNDSSTTTVVTLDVHGTAGQTADIFRVASSTGTSFFNVTAGGNVGIGTTTPDSLLTVAGTTNITGATTLGSTLTVTGNTTLTNASTTNFSVSGNSYLGTILSGTWNGTAIGANYGGTGQSTYSTGDMLYASGANTLAKRTIGSTGDILTVSGGVPTWAATSTLGFTTASDFDTCAEFAAIMTDETGTCGSVVLSASPTFTGTITAAAATLSSTLTMSGTAANIALGSNYLSGDGGDEGIFVDSSGNVGIGEATPLATFSVGDASSFTNNASTTIFHDATALGSSAGDFRWTSEYRSVGTFNTSRLLIGTNRTAAGSDWTTSAWRIQPAVDNSFTGMSSNRGYLEFAHGSAGSYSGVGINGDGGSTPDFMVNTSGNVGIGTTTPASNLVVSTTVAGAGIRVDGTGSINPTVRVDLNSVQYGTFTVAGAAGQGLPTSVLGDVVLKNAQAYAFIFGTNNTEYMRISSTGNVGIGTTTPAAKLNVLSTSEQLRLAYSSSVYWSDAIASDGGRTLTGFGSDGDLNIVFTGATDGDFSINTDDLFVDTSAACVAIGSTTCASTLSVTGGISTTGALDTAGSIGTWGSLTVDGSKNGYSGFQFEDVTGNGSTLMVHNTADIQGFINSAATWSWYFQNGTLTAGAVPASLIISDGAGSGLDADLLDGISSASFLRSDTNTTYSGGVLSVYSQTGVDVTNTSQINGVQVYQPTAGADALMTFHIGGDYAVHFGLDGDTNDLAVGGWSMGAAKYKIWHAGNDGAGSTLDADLLDGVSLSSIFNNMGQPHATQTDFNSVSDFGVRYIQGTTNGPGTGSSQFYGMTLGLGSEYPLSSYGLQLAIPRFTASDSYLSIRARDAGTWGSWAKVNAGRADTLLAQTSATFAGSITDETGTGSLVFSASPTLSGTVTAANVTLSGLLTQSASGIRVGSKDDLSTRIDSGFYETSSATTAEGWPENTSTWAHLISSTHSNTGNYYSMQIAGSFFDQGLYFRKTAGVGSTAWSRFLSDSYTTLANGANRTIQIAGETTGVVGRHLYVLGGDGGTGAAGGNIFIAGGAPGGVGSLGNVILGSDSSGTYGNVGIQDGTPTEAMLVVGNAGAGDIYLTLSTAGTTNNAVCWDNAGATLLYDCDATPADYAESYPVDEGVTYGDIVMTSSDTITQTDGQTVSKLVKAEKGSEHAVIGIVSNNYHDFTSAGSESINPEDNPMPVALSGRVPVKVNLEGGEIEVGDSVILSSEPGVATKATSTGERIGIALESYEGGDDTVLVFVDNGMYYAPDFLAFITKGEVELPEGDTLFNRLVTLAESFVDGVLKLASAEIQYVKADKVETNELCVGSVCVDEGTFLQMVEKSGGAVHAMEHDPEPEPEENTATSTDDGAGEGETGGGGDTTPEVDDTVTEETPTDTEEEPVSEETTPAETEVIEEEPEAETPPADTEEETTDEVAEDPAPESAG